MKLFDVDWVQVLREMHRWDALSFGARRALVTELKPNGYVPAALFGKHVAEIVASGIPQSDAEQTRLWIGAEHRALLKVLRAMSRHPLFDDPSFDALLRYFDEHFAGSDMSRIGAAANIGGVYYATKYDIAKRVAFAGWPGDFLACNDTQALSRWAKHVGYEHAATSEAFGFRELLQLQSIARALVAHPDGVTLRELIAMFPRAKQELIATALDAGLRTMVLFAGMRSADLEPMIGLWPAAARELARPPLTKPLPVDVTDSFALPVQVEDMTTVLAAIAAAPVRLRANDLAIFAKANAEISSRLLSIPAWASSYFVPPGTDRVELAAREIESAGFAVIQSRKGNPYLQATPSGMRWLQLSPNDRLESLVKRVRKAKDVTPELLHNPAEAFDKFFPFGTHWSFPKGTHLRNDLIRTFRAAEKSYIPLAQFLEFASREENPLLAMAQRNDMPMLRFDGNDPREGARIRWHHMLHQFFSVRLLMLGGASLGRDATGTICFRLTDVGRYMLGLADKYTAPAEPSGALIVQPNFDIVFTGHAPASEAVVARFAQRVGTVPGVAFRITRSSILGAAESGSTSAEILDVLGKLSQHPVPQNVQREISGWISIVRRASVRTVQVIECADEESAARVRALTGTKLRQVNAVMFEMPSTPAASVALLKKLRENGVLVGDTDVDAPGKAGRRGRRW